MSDQETTKNLENSQDSGNDNLLATDIETFGKLCTEMTETLQESQGKLETLKENLQKLNQDSAPTSGGNTFQYIDVKSMLLLDYVTSLQCYTLLKSKGEDLTDHEIFERLAYLRLMLEKLKPLDKKIDYQIEKLLRSALTQTQGQDVIQTKSQKEDNLKYKPNLENFDAKHITEKADEGESDLEEAEGESSVEELSENQKEKQDSESEDIDPDNINSDDIDSEELDKFVTKKQKAQAKKRPGEHLDDEEIYQAVTNNPIKMQDNSKRAQKQREKDQSRIKRVDLVREMRSEMLGLPEEVHYGVANGNKKLIEQNNEDEALENKYFKRISYTAKEKKIRDRKIKNMQKSDYSGITDGFQDFNRIQEFMGKTYGDEEDERKQFEKQKFLEQVRNRRRDKKAKQKFLDEEINSDEAGDDPVFSKLPKRSAGKGGKRGKGGKKRRR